MKNIRFLCENFPFFFFFFFFGCKIFNIFELIRDYVYRNVNSKSQKLSSLSKNGGNSTFCILTLSALQMKGLRLQTAEPNETARNEPPQQDLYCLPFCFWRLTHTSVWNKGSDQIQRWKSSLLKLKAERVESPCKVYGSVSPIIKEILFFFHTLWAERDF